MSSYSLSFTLFIPIFALVFFFESFRLFVSEIYFSNLATLSINISLIFILLVFLTILMPYIFPNKSSGMSIIVLSFILIILRFLQNFSYPAIVPRANFQPELFPVIIISGLTTFVSILVFGRSLSILLDLESTNTHIHFAEQLTLIFVLSLGIYSFFIFLGDSLDFTVQPTLAGMFCSSVLLLAYIIVLLLLVSSPLKRLHLKDQKIVNNDIQLSKKLLGTLTGSLGIILFFELYIIESPFVYASWVNSNIYLTIAGYGIIFFLILIGMGYFDFKKYFTNEKILLLLNILLLLFILDVGYFYFDFGLLGIGNLLLLLLLAGFSQVALIADFYVISRQLVGLKWKNIQAIIGFAPIVLILSVLYTGFTFVYPVLPSFLEVLFHGLLIPFMFFIGILLLICTYYNLLEVHG